ncbi:MAG TPA: C45 family autoproteolytic acyltransferase/hydrolase [Bryobacteraceae bacterium]|nr:C45 family autoproteolytic acyltransferase/hydrolase [Bryobacteraceae bacterium]
MTNRLPRALACFAAALACAAGAPLYQTSFEKPQAFTAVRGEAAPDGAVRHGDHPSLRVEPAAGAPDAAIRLAPVNLTIGKRYEVSGWVRSENLEVRDLDRSPIAVGATLSMASMPFDVHSTSIGGTREWTHLSLNFIASRAQDAVLLTVGNGGAFRGKAWFADISLDEVGTKGDWPARDAVATFGPAYRYPAAGWIYLHIEGKPYERGYQHGHLMAREIPEYLARCAADLGDAGQWGEYRTMANALFLRGFDREILEEMRGIAEGAADAGARWQNRRVDLIDLVVANVTVEMGELRSAMTVTPTGLENFTFSKPAYEPEKAKGKDSPVDHCSAFAATGPATRDGKMIVGHVTWWPLTLAEATNVMLDIKPDTGHRLLMQSYPGGIESGTDWYQNDAGVVLTETTIRQTPFNAEGTPVAFRAREAIQYGGSIDEVVARLGTRNNGLYTNEWIMGDAKTNEIAMYELGTNHTKLWRSSKNEWFGNTPGFYWGDNNAKDLAINLEYQPDPHGTPQYIPYVPMPRDLAWQDLYAKYKGRIDEQFGFLAFRSAPLVSASTMDAKIATADLAARMMVWAEFGKPNQREWVPGPRSGYAGNDGLYPNGYYLFDANQVPDKPESASAKPERAAEKKPVSYESRLWKGWILPASDADTWFVAGSAAYHRVLASPDPDKAIANEQITYRGLKLAPATEISRYQMEQAKGVLFLDSLRHKMGDDAFFKLMSDYFAANTTKTVTAQSFLDRAGVPFQFQEPGDGPAYLVSDIQRRLATAVLVYGTNREAGANRFTAEQMQTRFLDQYESRVPIYKDFEVSDDLLRHRDVIFIGRPEANSALAAWAGRIGLDYRGADFRIEDKAHASEREALLQAARNPLDAAHMVLIVAGNDAVRTVKASRDLAQADHVVYEEGAPAAVPGRRR